MARRTEDTQTVTSAVAQGRRRQVRGLLLIALVAIVFAILRAGMHRVFTTGWWRLW